MKKHLIGALGIALMTAVGYVVIPGETHPCQAEQASLQTADAVDIALDFVPGVNTVKDLLCLGLGVNPVTGEDVGQADAALLLGYLVVPWMGAQAFERWGKKRFRRLMVLAGKKRRLTAM